MAFSEPIEDQLAIRALNDSYCDAVSRRDAIVALWTGAMGGFSFASFFSQMGSLVIEGDRATGTVYTYEVLETADGTISRPVGRYDDVYVRKGDRRLYQERRHTMLKG